MSWLEERGKAFSGHAEDLLVVLANIYMHSEVSGIVVIGRVQAERN